jgi:hypothetical protein
MKLVTLFLTFGYVFLITAFLSAEVKKDDIVQKNLRFKNPAAKNLVIVDNVWGDVRVTGYDGEEIRMKAKKHLSARSEAVLTEIEQEVLLDITEDDTVIELYVDGPFRNGDHRSRYHHWNRYQDIEARFDFEIEIPKGTDLDLSTVNDGEITVQNVTGNYDVHNVNGGIVMEKIGGSGEAYSVNGDVTIDFVKNPAIDSRYGSLNGEVRLTFLPDLSADFHLKTFNGEIYSDFPVISLPAEAVKSTEKEKGRYVYKVSRMTAVRAGEGGPKIVLDGFNGDMFILKKK